MHNSAKRSPSRLEWAALPLLLLVVAGFGVMVEIRSAFLSRRMGDLTCYLRPAWAASAGESIYDIKDPNGWHYNYPPLYAILLIPLADPPPEVDHTGYVPYPVSVAIVYLLNMGCLALAVHLLAWAMQHYSADPDMRDQPSFCRRWWGLRVCPAVVCLAPVLHSAMRGQVNPQILAIFCAWIACLLAEKRRLGGFFLAMAICIKVIPVYLLVYPFWRRDWRMLIGCGIGLGVGLGVVPLLAFGPSRTVDEYTRYGQVLFGPLLQLNDDQSRHEELLGMDATDSMGVKHAIHCWRYPVPWQRPREYSFAEEWLHRILGVLMTLVVLLPARRSAQAGLWPIVHEVGLLLILMVIFSPVSHVHYFTFCLPLVMSMLFRRWQHGATLRFGWGLSLAFLWFVVAMALPAWPGLEFLRDQRLPLLGALPLWVVGLIDRWRCHASASVGVIEVPARLAA